MADQRSFEQTLPEVTASPCRELLITDSVRARAAELARQQANEPGNLGELFERIAAGHAVDGMESLAPVLVDGLELLIDVMPANTQILVEDPERIRSRAKELVATSEEFLQASWAAAAAGGAAPIDLGASAYRALADVRAHALERGQGWWSLSPFGTDDVGPELAADASSVPTRSLVATEAPVWRGDTEAAVAGASPDREGTDDPRTVATAFVRDLGECAETFRAGGLMRALTESDIRAVETAFSDAVEAATKAGAGSLDLS